MLDVGTAAPDFELSDHAGEPVRLSDHDRVVLYFYPRADTPGCTTEACEFRDLADEFAERGVTVLGVSDDPVRMLATFREKYDLPFRLLSDPDGEVASAYDSSGERQVFGSTVTGTFRNTYVVEDGDITHAYEGVTPEGHAEAVLADLGGEER